MFVHVIKVIAKITLIAIIIIVIITVYYRIDAYDWSLIPPVIKSKLWCYFDHYKIITYNGPFGDEHKETAISFALYNRYKIYVETKFYLTFVKCMYRATIVVVLGIILLIALFWWMCKSIRSNNQLPALLLIIASNDLEYSFNRFKLDFDRTQTRHQDFETPTYQESAKQIDLAEISKQKPKPKSQELDYKNQQDLNFM
jgi:hypothetical protein